MKRFGQIAAITGGLLFFATAQAQQSDSDSALLDQYLAEIESLISANDLEGAKAMLAEALTANLRDESLEMVQSQLRLLESLNASTQNLAIPAAGSASTSDGSIANRIANIETVNSGLTDQDVIDATDLLDSLRVAMENGEIDKVKLFTDPTPGTESLLEAVFKNYAAVQIEVSPPEADGDNQSFLATLEFKELTTRDGDTAYPAQAWKTHRVRIVKSDGSWQKVLW